MVSVKAKPAQLGEGRVATTSRLKGPATAIEATAASSSAPTEHTPLRAARDASLPRQLGTLGKGRCRLSGRYEGAGFGVEAAGGTEHHLVAVQLPVSLVMMTPIAQAFHGRGPLPASADAGLRVMASAPLHGGELPGMVNHADLIRPGLTLAQAVRSHRRVIPAPQAAKLKSAHWVLAAL
jgi:hypothetical protein